jgi:hypothetical protein
MASLLPYTEMFKEMNAIGKQRKSQLWVLLLIVAAIVVILAIFGKLGKWFSFLKPTNIAGKAVGLDHRILKSASPTFPDGTQMKWGDVLSPLHMLSHLKDPTKVTTIETVKPAAKKSGKWISWL